MVETISSTAFLTSVRDLPDWITLIRRGSAAALEIRRPNTLEEGLALELETIASVLRTPRERDLDRRVENESQIGLQPAVNPTLERRDPIPRHATPCALIRIGSVGKAFGNDPAPRGERGRNYLRDVLAARSKHQEGLGIEIHRLGEQERAQFLAQRRTARLARDYDVFSAPAQEIRHAADVRALACTVDTFQGDELAAAHRPERRRAPGN